MVWCIINKLIWKVYTFGRINGKRYNMDSLSQKLPNKFEKGGFLWIESK